MIGDGDGGVFFLAERTDPFPPDHSVAGDPLKLFP